MSNAEGKFEFTGPTRFGLVNLRASKDGYRSITTVASWTTLGVFSAPIILRLPGFESYEAIEAGDYTMTIAFDVATARTRIPDAPCPSYPVELASRTYDVRITAAPTGERQVSLTDLSGALWFSFPMFVADDRVVLDVGDDAINEDLSGFRLLSVWAFVPLSNPSQLTLGSSISFPVRTEFRYCELKSGRGIYNDCSQVPGDQRLAYHSCTSDQGSMTFTRR